ncbi:MAG: nucleoside triphosphate pyrophosphohydrolase [Spirochaetes bacterium]|nr:nucleoside triphosphate pyrophosphohydrolase [Spirochaetota bacterium]
MKTPPCSDDAIADLVALARDLRDPHGGCPWDIEQTHSSLTKNRIEEAHELVEVIENKENTRALKEELGDVLFQVVIHAQLAAEDGRFNFYDVARYVTDKLVSRHPHVYGTGTATNSEQVLQSWEAIKARERSAQPTTDARRPSRLDGVPKALPALQRAERLGDKASRVGFDWPRDTGIRAKIAEELAELEEALGESPARAEEEFGDLMFVLAQYARHAKIDAEGALRKACNKFERRFRAMELTAAPRIDAGEIIALDDWELLWQKVKASEA